MAINDMRHDTTTSYYLSEGLKLQSDYGNTRANLYLQIVGVPPKAAEELLAIGADRRGSAEQIEPAEQVQQASAA